MRWIRAHKIITCILAIIVALAIIFGISLSSGGSGFAGKGVNGAVTAGEEVANSGMSGARNFFTGILSFRELQAENEALRAEVEKLQKEILDAEVTKDQLKQLKSLSKSLDYKAAKKGEPVAADITAFDGSTWINTFTINRGSSSGIEKNDVVICGKGLVGRVTEVGKKWAKINAVVDENSKTSFSVMRDSDILGMVTGDGRGGLSGYVLDADSEIIEGDTLITTGMGMYPAGIEMGTVTEVEYNADTQIKNIKVLPSVNFRSMTKVVVIT